MAMRTNSMVTGADFQSRNQYVNSLIQLHICFTMGRTDVSSLLCFQVEDEYKFISKCRVSVDTHLTCYNQVFLNDLVYFGYVKFDNIVWVIGVLWNIWYIGRMDIHISPS